jgi:hypothetical protein
VYLLQLVLFVVAVFVLECVHVAGLGTYLIFARFSCSRARGAGQRFAPKRFASVHRKDFLTSLICCLHRCFCFRSLRCLILIFSTGHVRLSILRPDSLLAEFLWRMCWSAVICVVRSEMVQPLFQLVLAACVEALGSACRSLHWFAVLVASLGLLLVDSCR